MGNDQYVILPHLSIIISFIPTWRNNDQIIIILVAQQVLVSLLSPSSQALPIAQLSAAGSSQPPWSPMHQQLDVGHPFLGLPLLCMPRGWQASKLGKSPIIWRCFFTMSPHQMRQVALPPLNLLGWSMGSDGVSPASHGKFVHQVVASPGGMEEDLGAFLWQTPTPFCLAVSQGSKGKNPVSSCTNKVRKYLGHPRSWFC